MKTLNASPFYLALASLLVLQAHASLLQTAFTYQGRLADEGTPANGSYDLRFALYGVPTGGLPLGSYSNSAIRTNLATSVVDGVFTVTLDFGASYFGGEERWLQISVRTNGLGEFVDLSPRQPLTPSPYALYAPSAGIATTALAASSGAISNLSLAADAVTTDKIADGTLEPKDFHSESFGTVLWQTHGNSGTTPGEHFLGTIDTQPLEIRVGNVRALRVEPDPRGLAAPNLIGGISSNAVSPFGSGGNVIGGGGFASNPNLILTNSSGNFIGAGSGQVIGPNVNDAVVGGGYRNIIGDTSSNATIGGGLDNGIGTNSLAGTIAGGFENNLANNTTCAAIVGGFFNSISAGSRYSLIGGGSDNTISSSTENSTIVGGNSNGLHPYASYSTIGGGTRNYIGLASVYSTIGGGTNNNIGSFTAYATIPGGVNNRIGGYTDAGAIGGGINNQVGSRSDYATISGGEGNEIGEDSVDCSIGGGQINSIADDSRGGTIAGGRYNTVGTNAASCAIGGGYYNNIGDSSGSSTIAGGIQNNIGSDSDYSVIGGGAFNKVADNALFATIPGGYVNEAGSYAFAAGFRAKANRTGSFVWADSNNFDFGSTVNNGFFARAVGGVKFVTGIDAAGAETAGMRLTAGSSSWATLSDRAAKSNVVAVDTEALLEELVGIPIQTWNWNAQDPAIRHIGPMAQDFYAAFAVGEDNKHIATVDADGVALAAIQGLNRKVEAENAALRKEIAELRRLINRLTVSSLDSPAE